MLARKPLNRALIKVRVALLQGNRLTGPATLFASNGHRLEFCYEDGLAQGKASVVGANGDREECAYVQGAKQGPATYLWKAGHRYGWGGGGLLCISFIQKLIKSLGL